MLSYALGIGSFPSFIADEMDRNLGNLREMVSDMLPWVAKSQTLLGSWTSATGNTTCSCPCVSSDCFFFLFLSCGTSLIFISSSHTHTHTHTCTPPHKHTHIPPTHTCTQISTQPQTQGTTLEYQHSLYRLLYMEDFSYISLRFWICFIKREKLQNLVLQITVSYLFFFFCSCYFIMTESKSQRSLYEKMSSWVLHKIICLSPDYLAYYIRGV